MATDAEKKKVTLSFGMSKDKLKALAGNTLQDGGMEVIEVAASPMRNPGPLSDAFNAAAAPSKPPSRQNIRKFDI